MTPDEERIEILDAGDNKARIERNTHRLTDLLVEDGRMDPEEAFEAAMLFSATLFMKLSCGHEKCFVKMAELALKRARLSKLELVETLQ